MRQWCAAERVFVKTCEVGACQSEWINKEKHKHICLNAEVTEGAFTYAVFSLFELSHHVFMPSVLFTWAGITSRIKYNTQTTEQLQEVCELLNWRTRCRMTRWRQSLSAALTVLWKEMINATKLLFSKLLIHMYSFLAPFSIYFQNQKTFVCIFFFWCRKDFRK